MIHLLKVEDLQELISKNEVILIDVREQHEHDESRIEGSILMPLGSFSVQKVIDMSKSGKKIVIYCRSGVRSLRAC